MDFLVDDHRSRLVREADDQRLARGARNERESTMTLLLHIVQHDLRTQHVHRHHPHLRSHAI